jgi:prepilin-type processing-associated H-X9-DG protein
VDGKPSRFVRTLQLANPPPVHVFVFLDEHENTIDDGAFGLYPEPYRIWVNTPTDRHSEGGGFSYADGHAARVKWRWPKRRADLGWMHQTSNDQDWADLRDLQATIPQ